VLGRFDLAGAVELRDVTALPWRSTYYLTSANSIPCGEMESRG